MNNTCVSCGVTIPEGAHVCLDCIKKTEIRNKQIKKLELELRRAHNSLQSVEIHGVYEKLARFLYDKGYRLKGADDEQAD